MAKVGLWLRGAQGKYAGGVLQNAAGGGTILRENVTPRNPQTTAQVETRTGFKLMSQMASVMAPVIAMRREGAMSARNVFFKTNWPLVNTTPNEAQISYENIQLTKSQRALPGFSVTRVSSDNITTGLEFDMENFPDGVNRVVFVAFSKNSESKLEYLGSVISDIKATEISNTIQVYIPVATEVICYAYGMVDSDNNATVKYGNMQAASGVDIVRLLSQGSLSAADYVFTETRGLTLGANETTAESTASNEARVFVTASGPGTVTGGGNYAIGASVTVTATPTGASSTFEGWKLNGSETYVSTSASYTFTVQSNQTIDLIAVFDTL